MNITRKSAKRLASLAALGVGAVAVGSEEAQADIVYVDLSSSPGKVGFDAGFGSTFRIPLLPLGPAITFLASRYVPGSGSISSVLSVYARGKGGARLAARFFSGTLATFGKGATGSTSTLFPAKSALVGARTRFTSGGSTSYGLGTFTNRYALFAFPNGGQLDFGWILLSESVSLGGLGPKSLNPADAAGGPDVTILGYAYDTSGNPLPAGTTSPEPSTLELSGLGALALGAVGVRRWRAARRKAA